MKIDMSMTTDYYGFYSDKYNERLYAVGYKIVAVTELPIGGGARRLKIRGLDGTADEKEYTVDATDDMVNRFVEDMRRENRKLVDRLSSYPVTTGSITNSLKNYCRDMLNRKYGVKTLYDELDAWKCAKIHSGNLVSYELTPKCIQRRGTATIVHWKDGTQTKIVRQAGTEDAGLFAAFCMALSKKVFGTKAKLERAIQDADEEHQNAVIDEAKLFMKKRHAERMEQNRKRALKRHLRLERWKTNRQEEYWKTNLESMNQEVTEQIIRKVEFENDHE